MGKRINPRKQGPLRKIVREFNDSRGLPMEELECGHVFHQKQDMIGYTNAYSRRCWRCLREAVHETL